MKGEKDVPYLPSHPLRYVTRGARSGHAFRPSAKLKPRYRSGTTN